MSLAAYILRRLGYLVPQVLLISFITFVLVRLLPGDPARLALGPLAPESAVEQLRAEFNLDKPIWQQYLIWLKGAVQGDLGKSWVNNNSVTAELIVRTPVTLELIILSLLVVLVVLIPLAIVSASDSRAIPVRIVKRVTFGYGMLAGAVPDFVLGLLLIFVFYTMLGILPGPEGRLGIIMMEPPQVTGSILIDTLLAGDTEAFVSGVEHLILPVAVLAFVYGAPIFKMMRSQMGFALASSFSTFGHAIGLRPRTVFFRAARVAAIPTVVIVGVIVMYLIGGAVLVEAVFNFSGLGQYAVQSIVSADYAPIQAFVSLAAVLTMLIYLAVDLVHYAMDPRLKSN
ncbi:MAG TPA: ABC transporter permease [Bauldia sp.]|nr:ABC transporter permease [Bauldia sp.]